MHLLYSNPHPSPEFCSVSLVLKPDPEDPNACSMGEPLLLASPMSTISYDNAAASLKELHKYLTSVSKAMMPNKNLSLHEQMMAELFQDDDKLLDKMQVFRPLAAHGIALHYRLIRDEKIVPDFASLVLASSRTGVAQGEPENNRKIESDLTGVLICVGLSGLPFAHCSSSLQYSLSQRVKDCVGVLTKRLGTSDVGAAKTLLSTLLVSEDEMRKTNEVADSAHITAIPESGEDAGGNLQKSRSQMGSVLKSTKRLSVTVASGIKSGLFNRQGGLPGEANIHVGQSASSNDLARFMIERLSVLSVAESDSSLKPYETSGQQRKANLDLTGTKSRFRKRNSVTNLNPDLDNFDYKGPERERKPNPRTSRQGPPPSSSSPSHPVGTPPNAHLPPVPTPSKSIPKSQPKLQKSDGRKNRAVPTLSAPRGDMSSSIRRSSAASVRSEDYSEDDLSRRSGGKGQGNRRSLKEGLGANWTGDGTHTTEEMSQSSRGSGSAGGPRVQVNVALNEDLTCSYKFSKMTSCSVEGIIQVQVKSNGRSPVPFQLLVRDPSEHMQNLQENKKFAEDATQSQDDDADRRFKIVVPKADNYFPLIRYKCSAELKPVPIRVQTRVKSDGGHCRVALQISSNPHNEGSLTDLTIIMGVANDVRGESLVTQPAGGVWNASKRSVIWCVSELGDGEKFQLQARFEMEPDADRDSEDVPKFPVLVRCQCMYAQLSDVEVEVRDVDSHPADISMKVARRFRLSHQERS